MAMKMSKLKKMKMPEKKGLDLSEMEDMPMGEESPELEAKEEDLGMDLDKDMEAGEPAEHADKAMGEELAHLSDEQLLAELKKRGLMSEIEEAPEAESDELEYNQ